MPPTKLFDTPFVPSLPPPFLPACHPLCLLLICAAWVPPWASDWRRWWRPCSWCYSMSGSACFSALSLTDRFVCCQFLADSRICGCCGCFHITNLIPLETGQRLYRACCFPWQREAFLSVAWVIWRYVLCRDFSTMHLLPVGSTWRTSSVSTRLCMGDVTWPEKCCHAPNSDFPIVCRDRTDCVLQ